MQGVEPTHLWHRPPNGGNISGDSQCFPWHDDEVAQHHEPADEEARDMAESHVHIVHNSAGNRDCCGQFSVNPSERDEQESAEQEGNDCRDGAATSDNPVTQEHEPAGADDGREAQREIVEETERMVQARAFSLTFRSCRRACCGLSSLNAEVACLAMGGGGHSYLSGSCALRSTVRRDSVSSGAVSGIRGPRGARGKLADASVRLAELADASVRLAELADASVRLGELVK